MNELGLLFVGVAARGFALTALGAALYHLTRRSPPTAQTVALSTVTALVVASALTLSPLARRWTLPADGLRALLGAPATGPTAAGPTAAGPTAAARTTRPAVNPPASEPTSLVAAAWAAFVRELQSPASPARAGASAGARPPWRWFAWLAAALLGVTALGVARLAIGLLAVRSLLRRSRPITDPALVEEVEILRAEMSCTHPVALREADDLTTPATVGYRRAVVLLPDDWRGWDPNERRAVLAHELAHVAAGDYAAVLWCQVCTALHAFNPLAHWLVGRLRLQQELAADVTAARLAGGRQPYFVALAHLALRYDRRPVAGPARAFLPARDSFVRRIQMLRDRSSLEPLSRRRGARAASAGLLTIAAVVLACLRGPAPAPAQEPGAAAPAAAAPAAPITRDEALALIPNSARMALIARPADVLREPGALDLLNRSEVRDDIERWLGLPVQELGLVVVVWDERVPDDALRAMLGAPALVLLRSVRPHSWDSLLKSSIPEPFTAEIAGQSYTRSGAGNVHQATAVLDDRTIALGDEPSIQKYLTQRNRPRRGHDWDEAARRVGDGQLLWVNSSEWMIPLAQGPLQAPNGASFPLAMFAPLWTQAHAHALSLDVSKGLRLEGVTASGDEAGAKQVADTLQALLVLGRNTLKSLQPQLARMNRPGQPGAVPESLTGTLIPLAEKVLAGATVKPEGTFVRLQAQSDESPVKLLLGLVPAVEAARTAARRAQGANNLKQIGLAMHNYHDVNGHFPPAVLYGPDGKTPYSWRVALLPYLEQQALYNQYNFSEPWDGPNNRKLMDIVVPTYRSPQATGVPNHASYYVLTGPDTIFSGREGTDFPRITDGTSNTILVVETSRPVPWTKPEDIPYDPKAPLPELGGLYPEGFQATLADGSARFLSKSIAEPLLRALITKAGGEVIDYGSLEAPARPAPTLRPPADPAATPAPRP